MRQVEASRLRAQRQTAGRHTLTRKHARQANSITGLETTVCVRPTSNSQAETPCDAVLKHRRGGKEGMYILPPLLLSLTSCWVYLSYVVTSMLYIYFSLQAKPIFFSCCAVRIPPPHGSALRSKRDVTPITSTPKKMHVVSLSVNSNRGNHHNG